MKMKKLILTMMLGGIVLALSSNDLSAQANQAVVNKSIQKQEHALELSSKNEQKINAVRTNLTSGKAAFSKTTNPRRNSSALPSKEKISNKITLSNDRKIANTQISNIKK